MNQDFWIMRPLNLLFFITFASFVLLLVLASALLHNQSKKTRETVLITACVMTLLGFFVYKYYLSIDSEYNIITAGMGGFNWWGELPLQLCNINMILIPVAVLRNSKPLKCFCFFLARAWFDSVASPLQALGPGNSLAQGLGPPQARVERS